MIQLEEIDRRDKQYSQQLVNIPLLLHNSGYFSISKHKKEPLLLLPPPTIDRSSGMGGDGTIGTITNPTLTTPSRRTIPATTGGDATGGGDEEENSGGHDGVVPETPNSVRRFI